MLAISPASPLRVGDTFWGGGGIANQWPKNGASRVHQCGLLKPSKTLYGCLFDSEIGIGGFAHVWCTMTDDIQTKFCTVSVGAKAKQDRVS